MNPLYSLSDNTIYIPGAGLFLDSRKKRDLGYISHAHSDHSARHLKIICSEPTADFLQIRQKKSNCIKLPYNKKYSIGDISVSLQPAGHILGSSQILIESDEGRLLYTGDFRTKPARTVENYQAVKCDTLIMETTFGRSHYKFPPRENVERELLQLITDKLAKGIVPVVFAYPLGKSQEILHLISNSGIKIAADYSILRLAYIYKKYGVNFGEFEKFRRSDFRDKVLLMPVSFRHQRFIKNIANKYTIFMSGWGVDASAKFRLQVDKVMPYSDHADFDELIQTAVDSGASEIYCTHGFDDFVTVLRNMGLNAHPMIPKPQMDLFD